MVEEKNTSLSGQEGEIEDQSGEFLMMRNISVTSPKRMLGILRHPDTPGTGQSVRFGRRLYDDGDESRMSDMDSIGSLPKVTGRESEEDDTARHSVHNDISIASEISLPLLNPSMMEGYSDLHDTSLLHEDDGSAQHQSPSIDNAIPARSFDSDYQSDYKSAISPSSTRMDSSAHSDWATPKSRMSSIEDEENNLEAFTVKLGHDTSISDLSIPWSQQHAALLSPSSRSQNLQRDASQMQDMSSVYFPGALGKNILMESLQKESEKNEPLIDPLPIEDISPFGEILDASCNMDRVHTERTTMLLSRLQNAQEMYARLQKEFESEQIASQKARDELAIEKRKAKEKAEEHLQEMEHVRSLVAHLNEQSLRRKKEDSVLQTSIVNQSKEEGKEVDAQLIGEEENKGVNDVKNDTSASFAHAELSEVDAINTKTETDDQRDDLQLRFAEMKQLLEVAEAEKARYEARIQDLDEINYSVKVQLEETEKDKDAMREKVDSMNQQMAAIIEEKDILQEEAQNRDNLLIKGGQESQIETEKVAESSQVHKESQDTLKDTSQDISIIRTRLQEAKIAEQESKSETARLQEYADRLESELDKQKEEILEMQQSYAALQQENENLLTSLAESDLAREKSAESAERYVAKKDHDELLDLAEQMQARIDMIQQERTDERKRVASLEKELSNRGITIANLEKLHERLEEENLNLGIALSSKQQELSLLKRMGTKPLSSQTPRSTIRNRLAVRDLVMQSRTPIALRKQDTEGENTAKALPLQDLTTNQTLKSVDDTQENELPLLQKGPSHLRATRRKTIDGRPLLEDRVSQGSIKQPNGNDDRTISTSPASKAMPPPPMMTLRKSQSYNRSSTRNEVLDSSKTGSISSRVMKTSSTFGGGPRSSIAGSRYSTSSMSSSISAIRGPMDLSELTSSHN